MGMIPRNEVIWYEAVHWSCLLIQQW